MSRIALALVLALAACNGGDDGEFDFGSIPSGPLEGTIGGEAWTFSSGHTDSFLDDESDFFGIFYSQDNIGCDDWSVDAGNNLIGAVPTAPGEYEFSLSQNVTFYVDATQENLVATDGGIVVDSVEGGVVRGAMFATYDEDNEVGGEFELVICEDTTTF